MQKCGERNDNDVLHHTASHDQDDGGRHAWVMVHIAHTDVRAYVPHRNGIWQWSPRAETHA